MFLLIFLNIIHIYTTPYTMEGLNGRMAERKTQNRYEKNKKIKVPLQCFKKLRGLTKNLSEDQNK